MCRCRLVFPWFFMAPSDFLLVPVHGGNVVGVPVPVTVQMKDQYGNDRPWDPVGPSGTPWDSVRKTKQKHVVEHVIYCLFNV